MNFDILFLMAADEDKDGIQRWIENTGLTAEDAAFLIGDVWSHKHLKKKGHYFANICWITNNIFHFIFWKRIKCFYYVDIADKKKKLRLSDCQNYFLIILTHFYQWHIIEKNWLNIMNKAIFLKFNNLTTCVLPTEGVRQNLE